MILALFLLLAQARVDVADEADLHFTIGTEKFRQHDYRAALEHFLISNRLVPNRNVVFDIANTYAQLKQYPDAYRYYHQALEAEPDAKEKARIEKALARVAPSVAVLRVTTDPPGATIYIDRKDLGARGAAPAVLAFAPGKYVVIAEHDGYVPAQSPPVEARAGGETPVALKLERIGRTVSIGGSPAGAEVRSDSGDACTLPCSMQLPLGHVVLTAAADGYQRAKQDVFVRESGADPVEFELQELRGKLIVNADERGATVQIDGKLAGFTPALLDVPVGDRTVRVSLPGYEPQESRVHVEHGEQQSVDVQLNPLDEVNAASRTAESVDDAPSSVSIISGHELRAMNYPTIADALRGVRGVFTTYDSTYASLGFRGYGPVGSYGNKVLILVDGHSTNDDWIDSSYSGYDNRTDLDDIERIEVVRGPGSVLYGTGAFVGVVNLVTKQRDARRETSATFGTTEGGALHAHGATHQPLGADSGVDLSASGVTAGGRDFYFPQLGDSRGADGFRSGTVSARLWTGPLTLQAQAVARDKSLPSGEYETTLSDPRNHLIDRRAFAEGRFEPKLGDFGQLLVRGYFDRYTYDSTLVSLPGVPDGLRHERYTGDWAGIEGRLTLRPSSFLRLMIGGEWQDHFHNAQTGVSAIDTDAPQTYLASENPFTVAAAYAVADVFVTPRIHLSAGVRMDDYSTFGRSWNPRLALILKPFDGDVVKLMAGTAFRAPSIYELSYNDGGATQLPACPGAIVSGCNVLQPERVKSAELEITHHFDAAWSLAAAGYASAIDDVIELPTITDPVFGEVNQYQNGKSPVRIGGGELELRREWRQGWMAAVTYGYSHAWFASSDAHVPNSPEHSGSFKLAVPLIARSLTGMTRITVEGPRWNRDASAQTGAAVIWDLSLSGELPEYHLRYSFGVYNLADWKYDQPVSGEFGVLLTVPQAGRSVLSSLTLSL